MEKSETVKSGDGFIDRSKVRILLCDNDVKSSEEILTLLCGCSYQVTAVKSPRQVIDALNAEGPDIDIILSEVDLPLSKGLKMLKYIMRDKELRRIPLIMMSARDEVPVVVKCLKFGAADFLVKPLRRNELLNLWTHMWRKRRMLGLVEKNIISYDFDLVRSDHSDANTNSSTSFSDDADDEKSRNPKMCESIHHEDEPNTTRGAVVATTIQTRPQCLPDICNRRAGQILPLPKKRQLKIGESSAFFTYIKSPTSKSENPPQHMSIADNHTSNEVGRIQGEKTRETAENPSPPDNQPSNNSAHESSLMERSIDISQNDVAGCYSHTAYPYYMSGVINQVIPGMASYSYYPFGISLQPGQMPGPHPCPSFGNSTFDKVDQREAALMKFRQKRKERCFGKKIRYVNRKKLAECRPRLRGQFVRKVKVDLNGQPEDDGEEEQEYDEEDQTAAAMELSPQDDASMFQ